MSDTITVNSTGSRVMIGVPEALARGLASWIATQDSIAFERDDSIPGYVRRIGEAIDGHIRARAEPSGTDAADETPNVDVAKLTMGADGQDVTNEQRDLIERLRLRPRQRVGGVWLWSSVGGGPLRTLDQWARWADTAPQFRLEEVKVIVAGEGTDQADADPEPGPGPVRILPSLTGGKVLLEVDDEWLCFLGDSVDRVRDAWLPGIMWPLLYLAEAHARRARHADARREWIATATTAIFGITPEEASDRALEAFEQLHDRLVPPPTE